MIRHKQLTHAIVVLTVLALAAAAAPGVRAMAPTMAAATPIATAPAAAAVASAPAVARPAGKPAGSRKPRRAGPGPRPDSRGNRGSGCRRVEREPPCRTGPGRVSR